ncbi:MoaD/ThiS family protein [Corynebacterium pelargi]|uniref:ThiS family protein n=1 Tax=Corynebacterium pelargi TaxID=1471400 RepID=A0A410WBM3_9CORY|nr:MoaD/ThiS family protein [Corynebacterium pelargi]QAU53368.1 ThiS family protein [Corynebacterium pelargi]GGG72973.1 hypothetical protein GCM10007338_07670 [Corynebacterium pelargi]
MEIHYFAAARAARGLEVEHLEFEGSLGQLLEHLAHLGTQHTDSGLSLGDVLQRCTFLLDGARAEADAPLTGVQRVDILPPFAGG